MCVCVCVGLCDDDPCLNDGYCWPISESDVACECQPGFRVRIKVYCSAYFIIYLFYIFYFITLLVVIHKHIFIIR